MKIIAYFNDEGPTIQTVIEELLIDYYCNIKYFKEIEFESRNER